MDMYGGCIKMDDNNEYTIGPLTKEDQTDLNWWNSLTKEQQDELTKSSDHR
jgi:hypothetical protein